MTADELSGNTSSTARFNKLYLPIYINAWVVFSSTLISRLSTSRSVGALTSAIILGGRSFMHKETTDVGSSSRLLLLFGLPATDRSNHTRCRKTSHARSIAAIQRAISAHGRHPVSPLYENQLPSSDNPGQNSCIRRLVSKDQTYSC